MHVPVPVQAEIGRAVATNFLLAHLNAEQQALAFGRMQACTARQGDTIIAKGQPGDWFYVVASGSYDVLIGDEAVLSYCREDEADAYPSFGELAYISPISRLHLPYISPTSRLHLPYIAPTSPLHLPYISPVSPLHLPYISPTSPLHLP